MINAKVELLTAMRTNAPILCAHITYGVNFNTLTLPVGHTPEEYAQFLAHLDFTYPNDYGSMYMDGTVWLTDGTWFTRECEQGHEWWRHHKKPEIPVECYTETKP